VRARTLNVWLWLGGVLLLGAPPPAASQIPTYEWVSHADLAFCCEPTYVPDQLAIDSQTNLFVTGSFKSQASFSGLIVTGALNYASMFVVKYDRLGNALWARSAGRGTNYNSYSRGVGVATDASGAVYVAGDFDYDVAIGGFTFYRTGGGGPTHGFVAKYTANGSLAWAIKMETSGQASATVVTGLAMDSEANLHVVGFFIGGVGNFGGILLNAGQTGAFSHFHAKLSPSGTGLWVQKVDNIEPYASRLATDKTGNTYAVGRFSAQTSVGGFVLTHVPGVANAFIAKFGPAGDAAWVRRFSITPNTLAIDAAGQAHVSGSYSTIADFGSTNFPGSGSFLAKYSSAGDLMWAARIGTNFLTTGATVDGVGSSFLTGYFSPGSPGLATALFGTSNLTSQGQQDIFIAKYDAQANLAWVKQAGVVQGDSGWDVDLDPAGNLYASGTHRGTILFDNVSVGGTGGPDLYLAKIPAAGDVLPTITGVTQSQTVAPGSTVTFQVIAGGSPPLRYQWQLYGIELPGATNASHTISNVQPDNEGDYTVVVSNNAGSITSPVARLSLLTPPAIVVHPQSQTVIAGTNASFTVSAAGAPPLRYQWWQNNILLGGRTNSTLALANVQPVHAGNYFAVVTNSLGSATSALASLTVRYSLTLQSNGPGTVSRSPSFSSYPPGLSVTLTATPAPNHVFRSWSGDAAGNANPLTFAMDSNKTITASFSLPMINITIQGDGTVTKSPDRQFYDLGEAVQLTAVAGRWHGFTRWGDGSVTNPRSIHVGASNDYTAIFSPTTAVETLTFGGVSRTAPTGTPAVFVDSEFVVTSSVTRAASAVVAMQTTFPNGAIFYTLDGTTPSFASSLYDSPFLLQRSATLRATAYRADFSLSREMDPITITIVPAFTVKETTAGGGSVSLMPAMAAYLSNTVVTVTATPALGWTFLQWLGDASGTSATVTMVVMGNQCVEAVFGTTLGTSTAGGGAVDVDPSTSWYPYGTTARLVARPDPGNYFALWGNAASGNSNPLYFVITNAQPAIAAGFGPLNAGQYALTVQPDGRGQVAVAPKANRHNNGAVITLMAQVDPGQDFTGWSGDASGTNNPLVFTMDGSKVITAHFTKRPRLAPWRCDDGALEFQFLLLGEFGASYLIEATTDLDAGAAAWSPVARVTNEFGVVPWRERFVTNRTQRFFRTAP
jgi:uncharacterized repeat protein (TIGR02543 family)